MKVKSVLVSQPRPAVIEKSPFYELSQKHHVEIAYRPFIRVEGVSLKEFRAQRVEILTHTAVIFTSRTTVDSFFHICEEARITVPETMKYICQTEAVALYLQKYIVYRKRKISFADGSFTSLIELIIKHKEEKFLLALSEPHKPELPETLAKLKLSFDPVILARTVAGDLDDVKMADYDLLALYSPSDVKTLIEKFGTDGLPAVAVFGEGTLRAALGAGITVLANAPTPEAPSMVKAIDIYLQKVQKGEEIEPVELVTDARKEEFIRSQQHKLAKKGRTRRPTTESRKSGPQAPCRHVRTLATPHRKAPFARGRAPSVRERRKRLHLPVPLRVVRGARHRAIGRGALFRPQKVPQTGQQTQPRAAAHEGGLPPAKADSARRPAGQPGPGADLLVEGDAAL